MHLRLFRANRNSKRERSPKQRRCWALSEIEKVFIIPIISNSLVQIMKEIQKVLLFSCLVSLLFTTQSCALVFGGVSKGVPVKSGLPEGAKVYSNGSYVGAAPCRVKIPRNSLKNANASVTIKADGYEDQEVKFSRKLRVGAFVWDILLTGGIGLIPDFITGAIYKPYPKKVEYNLSKK